MPKIAKRKPRKQTKYSLMRTLDRLGHSYDRVCALSECHGIKPPGAPLRHLMFSFIHTQVYQDIKYPPAFSTISPLSTITYDTPPVSPTPPLSSSSSESPLSASSDHDELPHSPCTRTSVQQITDLPFVFPGIK